ncbi:ras-related protein Rap-2a-like [Haliotis rufescens]|uniref:ras-related protein Rap-2a-like n=1 Tax=Haliotis rufescens TaxID=6454 RepID=UPI00201F3DBC|nr:ras-related protein Rap-2a-like [Haliotis rufescens]
MAAAHSNQTFKIVVLGAPGVGKSTIISQFLHRKFIELHWFTIELEQQTTLIGKEGRQVSLEIVDTPGGYCFGARRRFAIESGDAFILVFSLEDECSFETTAMIREDILRIKRKKKVPILLVGNKTDIEDNKRITGQTGAERFAKKEWNTKYVEACGKDHSSVTRVFQKLLKLAKIKVELSSHEQGETRRFTFPGRVKRKLRSIAVAWQEKGCVV